MGIYIQLKRVGNAITNEEWQELYQETLGVLEKCAFADRIVEECYPGKKYYKTIHAKERSLLPAYNGNGCSVAGDMQTYQYAESFILIRNNSYYAEKVSYKERLLYKEIFI